MKFIKYKQVARITLYGLDDLYNNNVGAMIGVTPFTPSQKTRIIKNLSNNNLIPDGYGEADPFHKGIKSNYKQGGSVTLNAGGENHRIYVKTTNRGEGEKGNIMVNHPTMDKGMWDTIDLTKKAGVKTIAQGVAATKKWHKENPYMKQKGGSINLNLPVFKKQEKEPFVFNKFLVNDKKNNVFVAGFNPTYQNEKLSVGPYMVGVGNKYFQKFPVDYGVRGNYNINDKFNINMNVGKNNMNVGMKYNFKNGGKVKKAEPVVIKVDPETYTKNQYERSKDFHTKWMTSPMYNKMLKASDPVNAEKINKIRFDNLNSTRFVYEPIQPEDKVNTGGDSDSEGVVNIYPHGYNDNVSLLGTHEMSHSIDRPSVLFSGSEPDRVIPYEDVYRIDDYANVNRYNPKSLEDELYHKEFLDRYDYIATPTETRARLNEIRDSANQNKIYDPFTQKVNKKIFKKLTNFKFEKNPNWSPMDDLKSVYTDKQIINLLNTVSKKNNVPLNPQMMDNNEWEIIS